MCRKGARKIFLQPPSLPLAPSLHWYSIIFFVPAFRKYLAPTSQLKFLLFHTTSSLHDLPVLLFFKQIRTDNQFSSMVFHHFSLTYFMFDIKVISSANAIRNVTNNSFNYSINFFETIYLRNSAGVLLKYIEKHF